MSAKKEKLKIYWLCTGFSTEQGDVQALRAELQGKYTNDCNNCFLENEDVSTLIQRHYRVKIIV